jgi:hypothetical protein
MPRYFFDIRDGKFMPDDCGTDLPSLQAARVQAVAVAGELLRDDPEKFLDGDEWHIEVRDGDGLVLFTFAFVATDAPAAATRRPRAEPSGPAMAKPVAP